MKTFPVLCRAALIFGPAFVMSGCGSLFNPPPDTWWRSAEVKQILPASELTSDVHSNCVDASSAAGPTYVAIVSYRIGRAPYRQAFTIPAADAVHVGDTVTVNSVLCKLKVPT